MTNASEISSVFLCTPVSEGSLLDILCLEHLPGLLAALPDKKIKEILDECVPSAA